MGDIIWRTHIDELLGLAPPSEHVSPKTAQLLKRLTRIAELPPADKRAVLKLVDAMLDTRRRSAPPARARQTQSEPNATISLS